MRRLSYPVELRPDELLFSLISRSHDLSGNNHHAVTLRQLYGTERSPFNNGEECLNHLFSRLPKGSVDTPLDIIWNHTLVPYYKPFESLPRTKTIGKSLLSNIRGAGNFEPPSNNAQLVVKKSMSFCPECVKESTAEFGNGYWHRKHQLPGVDVCAVHEVLLMDSCNHCGFTYAANGRWEMPKKYCPKCGYAHESLNNHDIPDASHQINFARISWQLMTAEWFREVDATKLPYIYRQAARDVGLDYEHSLSIPHYYILEKAFRNHYGEDFLEKFNCTTNVQDNMSWIHKLLHVIHQNQNTTHHILLIAYLFDSLSDFKIATTECMNASIRLRHGYTQEVCSHFSTRLQTDTKGIPEKIGFKSRMRLWASLAENIGQPGLEHSML